MVLLGAIMALSGCSSVETSSSFMEKASLTAEEAEIADMFQEDGKDSVLDFTVDETVQSVHFQIDELQDGQWVKKEDIGGIEFFEKGNKGRILLNFTSLQDESGEIVIKDNGSVVKVFLPNTADFGEEMQSSSHTKLVTEKTKIEYEKEIPLFIECWDKENVAMRTADPMANPQSFAEAGNDHTYLLTAVFSQKDLAENKKAETE